MTRGSEEVARATDPEATRASWRAVSTQFMPAEHLPRPGPGLCLQAELFLARGAGSKRLLSLGVKRTVEGASFPEAAVTNRHQPRGLEQQESLLSQSGAQTSKIRVTRLKSG